MKMRTKKYRKGGKKFRSVVLTPPILEQLWYLKKIAFARLEIGQNKTRRSKLQFRDRWIFYSLIGICFEGFRGSKFAKYSAGSWLRESTLNSHSSVCGTAISNRRWKKMLVGNLLDNTVRTKIGRQWEIKRLYAKKRSQPLNPWCWSASKICNE